MRLLTRKISARLSTLRRSRLAAPAVLIVGLLASAGLYVALAPANANKNVDDAAMVAKGKALFLVGCSSCHGTNGEGISTVRDGYQIGPSLVGVGAAAVDFQVGTGRMPMARPGVQAPVKNVVYTEDEIAALAAFVASLGAGPAIPTSEQYDPASIPEDELEEAIVRGGQFFRTNCTACHNFAGAGGALPEGKYAPALQGVTPKHIYEALLTGPQQMPVFSDGVLKSEEKRDIIAYLKSVEETPKYGGASMGSLGPVSDGLFAWIVGIGGLVGFTGWIASNSVRSKKGKKA